ncbi:MAG: ATP-binding cassette domain-containing protein, partial [Clostridium sp.]
SYFHIAMNGMAASDRIFGILDAKESKDSEIKSNFESDNVHIELKNVSFSYDGERQVLNNINISLKESGLTAIVGESGSGKSTIASLILNNYKATNGEILLNNININNISNEDIYNNIALVSTNSYIFNGSILDNLLMAKKDATKEEINNALKISRLEEFIDTLENGLLTDVGQAGNALSGGQKQRLALARVILSNRKNIIFDEATSNIDVESEESIWEAINELAKDKKIVVISHRLANIKDAKNIYVMKNGNLVEEGIHSELLNLKGHYYNMVSMQNELEAVREVS